MTHVSPERRPTATEALKMFNRAIERQSSIDLKWRLLEKNISESDKRSRRFHSVARYVRYIITRMNWRCACSLHLVHFLFSPLSSHRGLVRHYLIRLRAAKYFPSHSDCFQALIIMSLDSIYFVHHTYFFPRTPGSNNLTTWTLIAPHSFSCLLSTSVCYPECFLRFVPAFYAA